MDKRKFESDLERLMRQDFAAGTEAFRDALLARCLDTLGSDDGAVDDMFDGAEVDDSLLDLLAAAGDVSAFGDGPRSDDYSQTRR